MPHDNKISRVGDRAAIVLRRRDEKKLDGSGDIYPIRDMNESAIMNKCCIQGGKRVKLDRQISVQVLADKFAPERHKCCEASCADFLRQPGKIGQAFIEMAVDEYENSLRRSTDDKFRKVIPVNIRPFLFRRALKLDLCQRQNIRESPILVFDGRKSHLGELPYRIGSKILKPKGRRGCTIVFKGALIREVVFYFFC